MVACGGTGSLHAFASELAQPLLSPCGVGEDARGFLVAPSHIPSLSEVLGAGLSPGKSKHIFCVALGRSCE